MVTTRGAQQIWNTLTYMAARIHFIYPNFVPLAKRCINLMKYYLPVILLSLFNVSKGMAQTVPDTSGKTAMIQDTVIKLQPDTNRLTRIDTTKRAIPKKIKFEPVPKRAGLYAAIIPGLGQVYNRQYWKLPIVYAALGAGGYFIYFNLDKYRTYRKAYVDRLEDPTIVDEFSDRYTVGDLKNLQEGYRQNADVSVLLTAVGYSLQIMDAIVSAHLKNFDVSRDISMQFKPVFNNTHIGIGLAFNFK